MPALSAQTLFADGACFACYGATAAQIIELDLLVKILKNANPMAATDPQSLIAYGKCYACYTSGSFVDIMRLALLDQIVQAGGGGGGVTQVYSGSWNDPNGHITPTDTNAAAIYYKDDATPYVWGWSITGQDWSPQITP